MPKPQYSPEDFILKAKAVHKDRFDYSKSRYTKYHEKVQIICHKHGIFEQTPAKHLAGKGCPRCAGRKSHAEFIAAARGVHGDRFDYSETIYTNGWARVTIICREHGPFRQVAREHLSYGCARCAGQNRTIEEFLERAGKQHGDRYDYTKMIFKGMEQKVEILCEKHGAFWQLASGHLKGNGCPKCSRNTSKAEHLWLDSLGIPQEHRRKSIKIPGYKRALTVDAYDPTTNTIYEFYGDLWHGNPKVFDQGLPHRVAKGKGTYGDLYRKTVEREQKIKDEGYHLVTIWESDWNEKQA